VAATLASRSPPRLLPLLELAVLVLVWGMSVPLTKLGLRSFSPPLFTAMRYLVAAPCMAVLLLGRPLPTRRALLAMAVVGFIGVDIGQLSQTFGVQHTRASIASVITATIPGLTVLLAVLRLRQPLRAAHVAGLLVAFSGVAIAAASGRSGGTGGDLLGPALMLASAVCIALSYVLSAELSRRHGVVVTTAWVCLGGAFWQVPVAAWQFVANPPAPGPWELFAVAYVGVMVTVAGMLLWLRALRQLPARIAAGSQYFQPLVAVIVSALLFGDPLGGAFALGTACVLAGVALATLPGSARPRIAQTASR
jgi:O-acetylserine/cysteine efflux transporter